MSIVGSRWMGGLVGLVGAWAGLSACSGRPIRSLKQAGADPHDPCILLAANEAMPYVGVLATPPYRASDGAPDAQGDECVYRGKDGREITVRPDWSSAGAEANASLRGATATVAGALNRSAGGASGDSMANRVVKNETGPWDQANWIPGGSLFASKADRSAQIDVSAASGQEADALAIARIVMPRFDHPLSYDGAKAVALVPKPPAHPANACDFLPRAAVEAAIGPLAGDPSSDTPETSCVYKVKTPQGERDYPVEFVWQNGQKNFAMLKHGMATTGEAMGMPTSSPMDTMTPPPEMRKMMGGMMKMLGGPASAGKAPGASSTVGFRTDTTLAGPWDGAALLHGTQLIAVRHDVFVGMTLESADYDHAKALLTAICNRL